MVFALPVFLYKGIKMAFVLSAQLRLNGPSNVRQIVNQINSQLKGVNVNVTINTSAAISQLNNMQKALNNTSKTAVTAKNDIEKFGEQSAIAIRRYGAFTVATTGFINLTRAISSGIGEAIKFDRELVRLTQVTGQSLNSIKGLSDEVTRLSKEFGVSSTEILNVSVVLAQAGLSVKDTKTALEALAKTSVSATFGDIKDTTEASIAIMQQFGKKAQDLEKILGSVNAVSAKYAVESEDITAAVRRAGGAFQAAGGNLEEFQALFTSVRQTTRESAETIATGFRTIFTRLQRTRTQDFLKTLGIDVRDIEGQFVGPYEAVRRLSEALKGIKGTDPRFAQIVEELGGFRQISKVIPLITKFDVAQEALNVAIRGGSSLSDDAAKSQAALSIQISKVKEEFSALIRTFTNSDSFKGAIELTLKFTTALIKLVEALDPVLPLLASLGAAKIGQGAGAFFTGFNRKIKGFATGGLVPGSGDGDTVPAMLTPGEFVMRKSAVNAIGLHNLRGLNKYNTGTNLGQGVSLAINSGTLANFLRSRKRNTTGLPVLSQKEIEDLSRTDAAQYANIVSAYNLDKSGRATTAAQNKAAQLAKPTSDKPDIGSKIRASDTVGRIINAPAVVTADNNPQFIGGKNLSFSTTLKAIAGQAKSAGGNDTIMKLGEQAGNVDRLTGNIDVYGLSTEGSTAFSKVIQPGLSRLLDAAIKKAVPPNVRKGFLDPVQPPPLSKLISDSAINSISGTLFEAMLKRASKNITEGEIKDDILDIASPTNLSALIPNGSSIGPADAKVNASNESIYSTIGKGLRAGITKIQKFATGGMASGTDTVPALLTPGEFVINKASAQAIGYHNLKQMNNVKKFATGGTVGNAVSGIAQNPLAIFGILSVIKGLESSASNTETAFSKLTDTVSNAVVKISVLSSVLGAFKDSKVVKGISKYVNPIFSGDTAETIAELKDKLPKQEKALRVSDRRSNRDIKKAEKERLDLIEAFSQTDPNGKKKTFSVNELRDLSSSAKNPYYKNLYASRAKLLEEAENRVGSLSNTRNIQNNAYQTNINNSKNRIAKYDLDSKVSKYGQFAGALASSVGTEVSNYNLKKIVSGNGSQANVTGAGIGGILSGAGTGAAIGAMFGPWGIAIGAAVGGIYGFVSATKEAEKQLRAVDFTKSVEKINEVLLKVESGRLSSTSASSSIVKEIQSSVNKVNASASTEERSDLLAQFKQNESQLERFFSSIASNVTSFKEFDKVTKGTLRTFSYLTKTPYGELEKQINNVIDSTAKLRQSEINLIGVRKQQFDTIIGIKAFQEAIASASSKFSKFDAALLGLQNSINGTAAAFSSFDPSDLFDRAIAGNISNTSSISNAASSLLRPFGKEGKFVGTQATTNTAIINKLPSILKDIASQNLLDANGDDFIKKLEDAITNQFGNADAAKQVAAAASGVIGPEGKSEKILSAINEDVFGVAQQLGKALETPLQTLKDLAPLYKSQAERLKQANDLEYQARVKIIDYQVNIVNKLQDLQNFSTLATGGRIRSSDVARQSSSRIASLYGSSDINQLKQTLINAQARQAVLTSQASTSVLPASEAKELNTLNITVFKTKKALEELGDASEILSAIQSDLANIEERRKFKLGLADVAAFGSREDKARLSGDIALTAQAFSKGIGSVDENSRGRVLSFLQSGPEDTQIFGKETFKTVLDKLRGQAVGNNIPIDQLTTAGKTPEATVLISEYKDAVLKSVKATEALQSILTSDADRISVEIAKQNKEFLSELRTIFFDRLKSDANASISNLTGQRNDLIKSSDASRRLSQVVGKGNLTVSDIQDISGVGSILSDRLAANKKFDNRRSVLSSVNIDDIKIKNLQSKLEELFTTTGIEEFNKLSPKDLIKTKATLDKNNKYTVTIGVDTERILSILNKAIEDNGKEYSKAISENNKDLSSSPIGRTIAANLPKDDKGLEKLVTSLVSNSELAGKQSFTDLQLSIDRLTQEIQRQKDARNAIGKNFGGKIPGSGNRDTVPAMLTPGEFVIRKDAVNAVGLDTLHSINNMQHFAKGGEVQERKRAAAIQAQLARNSQIKYMIDNAPTEAQRRRAVQLQEKIAYDVQRKIKAIEGTSGNTKTKSPVNYNGPAFLSGFVGSSNQYVPVSKYTSNKFEENRSRRLSRENEAYVRNQAIMNRIDINNSLDKPRNGASPEILARVEANRKKRLLYSERNANISGSSRKFATGGPVSGGSSAIRLDNLEQFRNVVRDFSVNTAKLTESLDRFPRQIDLNANHKVEVIFNGAEVLSKLIPEIQSIAIAESKKAINNMIDTKFPDVGRV